MISIIAAMSENRVIGINGRLPWHLPNDLRRFKQITWGKNILMGRVTFNSINRPLPGRNNLVLTKNPSFEHENITVIHSLDELWALKLDELMVIGGEEIYRLFLPLCSKIYLTLVHTEISGDAYFPEINGFKEVARVAHEADEKHIFAYSFIDYEKVR